MSMISFSVYSQVEVSGRIVDEENHGLPYVNVVMLNHGDSTLITGTISDFDGNFSFKTEKKGFLKVSCMGYEDYYIDNLQINMPEIVLRQSDLQLDAVDIIAERKKIQINGDAMVTNVSGTPIAKLSDIQHVLNVVPGLVSQNETLKVLGKGEPLVFINNRKIRDLSEVFQLSPDNIKNIELITNPGAKYDSEVKAVLIINTVAPTGEGLSIDNKLSVGYQYKTYYSDNLKLNYRKKNLDVFASCAYSETKSHENVISTDETFLSSYYNMHTDDDNYAHKRPFSSKIGLDYGFNSGNSIGIQYSNALGNSDMESCTSAKTYQDQFFSDMLHSNNTGESKSGCHLVNVYNSGRLLSWDYEMDFDAMFMSSDYEHLIDELSDKGSPMYLDCNEENKSSLYAFKLEFYRDLLKGDITFGTEHTFVDRNGVCEYLNNMLNNSDCSVRDRNSAVYGEFSQYFDVWSFTAGLRYELVRSDYYEFGTKQGDCCRKYHDLCPSLSFNITPGDLDIQISYDRSVQRPYYDQLNNNVGFITRYSYETGNPLLKPSYIDDFCINLVYGDFSFMADYMVNHDYIYDSYTMYGDNSQVSLVKPDNYGKFNSFQSTVAYSPTFGLYRPNLSASLFWQDMSIVFCGNNKIFDSPSGYVMFSNLFDFPKKTTLNVSFNYSTPGDDELGWVDENFACNFEFSKGFGNWTVAFVCDDVFGSENHRFNLYGNVRKCTIEKNYDTRKIELSVRYQLNPAKSKYKGTGAGNDEKERM